MKNETAIVILNYLTIEEPLNLIESIDTFIPGIKVFLVDNGSPEDISKILEEKVQKFSCVSFHNLSKNSGFARGNNFGIKLARNEGYEYIISSNSDILLTSPNTIDVLIHSSKINQAAVIGPSIINLNHSEQNPFLEKRPTPEYAYSLYKQNTSIIRILLSQMPSKIKFLIKKMLQNDLQQEMKEPDIFHETISVYSLHGSFMMFTPLFFHHYDGFDPNTFLYGEELILGEMLHKKGLKAYFEPQVSVKHLEDRTSNLIWSSQQHIKPRMYLRDSTSYWYKEWFKK